MPIVSATPPVALPPSGAAGGALAGTYPNPTLAAIDRYQVDVTGQAVFAETFDRKTAAGAAALMIDGTLYLVSVGLRAADVVTSLTLNVSTGGAALTLSKVGLLDKTGARLGISAEQGAAWQSAGVATVPLIAPVVIPSTDGYYFAVVSKGGTLPTVSRGSISVTASFQVGAGLFPFASIAAQTDIPIANVVAKGTNPIAFWLGAA